jgi:hypothetical protein
MQNKQRLNHDFLAIKLAVDARDLTIQEANDIIIKQKKESN